VRAYVEGPYWGRCLKASQSGGSMTGANA
jgi:hypothetical protein